MAKKQRTRNRKTTGSRNRKAKTEAVFNRLPGLAQQLANFANTDTDTLFGMEQLERNALFEQFVTLQILRRWYLPQMTASNLPLAMTGKAGDDQIDALGILVNNKLVNSVEDAREEFESTDNPRVTFVFIQTTATQKFIRTKMNDFIVGVKHLFADETYWTVNEAILAKKKIAKYLWGECEKNREATLEFDLFYVALGNFTEEKGKNPENQPLGWRRYAEHELQDSLGLVGVPMVNIVDARRLVEIVQTNEIIASSMQVSLSGIPEYSGMVPMETLLPLPAIEGVESGYLGYLGVNTLLDLLERDDGQGLLDDIGFTNVRAFLGEDNKVNQEIEKTLTNADKNKFVLLNNGITLVAEAGRVVKSGFIGGKRFLKLDNYQIVNGLQTSYMIYRNKQKLGGQSGICIPVKIVVSDNIGLQLMVAEATNRQSAINPGGQNRSVFFGFRLEEAFDGYRQTHPLQPVWYERQEGRATSDIPEESLFSRDDLLRLMVAAFQAMPHQASQGPAGLAHKMPREIFNEEHSTDPYLAGALMGYYVRRYCMKEGREDLARFTMHMVYGLSLLIQDATLPVDIGSQACVDSCPRLLEKLEDQAGVEDGLETVERAMREILKSVPPGSRQMSTLPRSKKGLTMPLRKALSNKPDMGNMERISQG